MVIEVNAVQFKNALAPILVTLSGMAMEVNAVQFENVSSMLVTSPSITTFVRLFLSLSFKFTICCLFTSPFENVNVYASSKKTTLTSFPPIYLFSPALYPNWLKFETYTVVKPDQLNAVLPILVTL